MKRKTPNNNDKELKLLKLCEKNDQESANFIPSSTLKASGRPKSKDLFEIEYKTIMSKALFFYFKALDMIDSEQDNSNIIDCFNISIDVIDTMPDYSNTKYEWIFLPVTEHAIEKWLNSNTFLVNYPLPLLLKSLIFERIGDIKGIEYYEKSLEFWDSNCSSLMSIAHLERDSKRINKALEIYKYVSNLKVFDGMLPFDMDHEERIDSVFEMFLFDERRACIRVATYQSALVLSILNNHEKALKQLKRFGCKYRISPKVWELSESRIKSSKNPQLIPRLNSYSKVVPMNIWQRLVKCFSDKSPYWAENDYEKSEYFSWWVDMENKNIQSENIVEILIKDHLYPLLERDDIVGCEWWAHCRPAGGRDDGHQAHFDAEEATMEIEGRIIHPVVSSVLYITGGINSGCTVIFDQNVDAKNVASQGWLVYPSNRSFVTFPGELLHCVLPCKYDETVENTPDEFRIVLLIGFWNRKDFAKQKSSNQKVLTRQKIPRSSRNRKWPDLFSDKTIGIKENDNNKNNLSLERISPIWEKINSNEKEMELPHHMDKRFFINDASDFKNRLIEEHFPTD